LDLRVSPITAVPPAPTFVEDTGHRRLRDLRISVIDRCNFRCIYCMPKTVFGRDYPFLQRAELLSFEEIMRVASACVDLGVEKIRITGGEPLLRRDLERLIELLACLPVELTLTTNGSLLKTKARALKDAGLQRVTVSLDAIDEAVFRRMNDADYSTAAVLEGIDAADAAGLMPIKVNCVVKRGVNDSQILPLARHFRHTGHILRFIEYMDAGTANGWRMDDVVPSSEVLARIASEYSLTAIDAAYPGEVAERWRYADGSGELGVIASVTQAFCSSCTRLRLSTDGKLYTCLFASAGHDLRTPLRNGASMEELAVAITGIWSERADRYSEIRTVATAASRKIEMSYIGG
jgi:cyclic pyranopterin phosphate synthase